MSTMTRSTLAIAGIALVAILVIFFVFRPQDGGAGASPSASASASAAGERKCERRRERFRDGIRGDREPVHPGGPRDEDAGDPDRGHGQPRLPALLQRAG